MQLSQLRVSVQFIRTQNSHKLHTCVNKHIYSMQLCVIISFCFRQQANPLHQPYRLPAWNIKLWYVSRTQLPRNGGSSFLEYESKAVSFPYEVQEVKRNVIAQVDQLLSPLASSFLSLSHSLSPPSLFTLSPPSPSSICIHYNSLSNITFCIVYHERLVTDHIWKYMLGHPSYVLM